MKNSGKWFVRQYSLHLGKYKNTSLQKKLEFQNSLRPKDDLWEPEENAVLVMVSLRLNPSLAGQVLITGLKFILEVSFILTEIDK